MEVPKASVQHADMGTDTYEYLGEAK